MCLRIAAAKGKKARAAEQLAHAGNTFSVLAATKTKHIRQPGEPPAAQTQASGATCCRFSLQHGQRKHAKLDSSSHMWESHGSAHGRSEGKKNTRSRGTICLLLAATNAKKTRRAAARLTHVWGAMYLLLAVAKAKKPSRGPKRLTRVGTTFFAAGRSKSNKNAKLGSPLLHQTKPREPPGFASGCSSKECMPSCKTAHTRPSPVLMPLAATKTTINMQSWGAYRRTKTSVFRQPCVVVSIYSKCNENVPGRGAAQRCWNHMFSLLGASNAKNTHLAGETRVCFWLKQRQRKHAELRSA